MTCGRRKAIASAPTPGPILIANRDEQHMARPEGLYTHLPNKHYDFYIATYPDLTNLITLQSMPERMWIRAILSLPRNISTTTARLHRGYAIVHRPSALRNIPTTELVPDARIIGVKFVENIRQLFKK
jgi:hypothetical protein